jgi:cysteinyl-tRNA synthetase
MGRNTICTALDLIFPHHEAEIAQMESVSGRSPMARYWMHTGLLHVDGAKVSRSAGSFVTIRDALAAFDFRTVRYAFLASQNEAGALLRGRADAAIAQTLLAAAAPSAGVAVTARNQACALGEELTAKELEVLRLLTTRLSRREIGQRLYVSLNTVKTHQRALYRKLGVEDRSAAVKRARELGLLSPTQRHPPDPGRSHIVAGANNPAVITRVNRRYG